MNYQSRIREIQSSFVMGYQDRETCIQMFEELLHEYGLLPKEEQLDRTITNENFLQLLKIAKEQHEAPFSLPQTSPTSAEQARNLIRDSVKQRCPVCQKPAKALFNRVQGPDTTEAISVDPPRCEVCMTKWIDENFGVPSEGGSKPSESFPVDHSPASPMSPSETEFFAQYEKQMKEK